MLGELTRNELTKNLPAIMTINDISAFLRCSSLTVRRLIKDGELEAYKLGEEHNRWNINRRDFLRFLSRNGNM